MIRRPSTLARSRGQTERQVEDHAPDLHLAARDHRDWRQLRVNARICDHAPAKRMTCPAQRILVGHETSMSACAVVAWLSSPDEAWSEATFPPARGGRGRNAARSVAGNRASRLW